MEVRNSAGHRVSLLNDEASSDRKTKFAAPTISSPIGRGVRLPPFSAALAQTSSALASSTTTSTSTFVHRPRPTTHSAYSYSSSRSYGSASSASSGGSSRSPPDTPPLERSDSRDSSTMNGSLSPSTPTYPEYDAVMGAVEQGKPVASLNDSQRAGPYFGNPTQLSVPFGVVAPHAGEINQWYSDVSPMSPPFGNTPGYPIQNGPAIPGLTPTFPQQQNPPIALGQQQQLVNPAFATAQPPLSSPTSANPSDRRSSTTKGKNNKFPCPLAAQYQCSDTFTTSGHAARHAKKHTGKKDAICPECRKAFTRKDNMEQHRRTHKNGKNQSSARAGTADAETSSQAPLAASSHARKASTASMHKAAPAGAASIAASSPRAARPAPLIDPSAMLDYSHQPLVDPQLGQSPTSNFSMSTGRYPDLPTFNAALMVNNTYPDPTGLGSAFSPMMSSAGPFGEQSPIMGSLSGTNGLDALSEAAAAASNSSEEDLRMLERR